MDRISYAMLLDPMLDFLVVLGLALLLAGRRRKSAPPRRAARWGLRIARIWWLWMWLMATPRVSFGALWLIEMPPTDVKAALGDTPEDRCVMIVLTGGHLSPRDGVLRAELLSGSSLPRAIGAARVYLQRPVGHVIVTGRAEPWGYADETAASMGDVMVAFGVPRERILIEPMAQNTRQNAVFSALMARGLDAEKVVVVTSASHIPRAILEFERTGLHVIAAPVDHRYEKPESVVPYIPSTEAFVRSGKVLHEVLGRFRP
ncbi:MAG: YdcF family protein [Polyangiaceae bacterium]